MERKELVKRLANHLGVKSRYLGAPSFAYRIETKNKVFTIDRNSEITDLNGRKYDLEEAMNYKEEKPKVEVVKDMKGHTGNTLKNLVNTIYTKQQFIKKAFEIEKDFIKASAVEEINNHRIIEIEDFKEILENIDEEKYTGLDFNFEKGKIIFKFYKGEAEGDKLKAYMQLVSLLDEKAKKSKRASSKVTTTDNPKYTFRTFLLRLGMIGDKYKLTRKILLKNLSGNSAFRKGGKNNEL